MFIIGNTINKLPMEKRVGIEFNSPGERWLDFITIILIQERA